MLTGGGDINFRGPNELIFLIYMQYIWRVILLEVQVRLKSIRRIEYRASIFVMKYDRFGIHQVLYIVIDIRQFWIRQIIDMRDLFIGWSSWWKQ